MLIGSKQVGRGGIKFKEEKLNETEDFVVWIESLAGGGFSACLLW